MHAELSAIRTRPLGKTGVNVTQVGLGGEGVLRTYNLFDDADKVIDAAVSGGITYFDSAHAYAHSENYYGRYWSQNLDARKNIFQTSKSARRDREGALEELDRTLKAMNIGHLDLWQIHDVRTQSDIRAIESPDGALEAFLQARDEGKTRFIGVTGHYDPDILTYCVENWPVDTVLLPVNPVEAVIGGFMDKTLQAARDKKLGIIGMKVVGASYYIIPDAGVYADTLIRYALSQDISCAIVGCSTSGEVRTLLDAGRDFIPMSKKEQDALVNKFRPYAKQLSYYRKKT
ncbi:MAG: aldo/keto reductase [Caulobacteraceae bacterium]